MAKKPDPHAPIVSDETHWRNPSTGDLSLDEFGREILSPLPMEPPLGYKKQKSLTEQIRDMVRSEALAREARLSGHETFAESEDFECDEDYDPYSPFEEVFEPEIIEGSPSLTAPGAAQLPPEPAPPSQSAPAAGGPTPGVAATGGATPSS